MRALLTAGRLPRGEGRRLALAVALATGAMAASIALLATSGYLISRAAQRPPILELMVAIVAVRAFGITRACMRYGERLSSHDLAFRQLARLRVRFFERLAPLVPGRLSERSNSSGELLSRFVGDVDTLSDLYLRSLIPSLVALATIFGASLAAYLILPAAGLAVLVSLLAASIVLPYLGVRVAAVSGRRQAGVRARMTGELVESIDGAAELVIAGRAHERVERLGEIDSELARLGRRDALASALSTGLGSALLGVGLVAVVAIAIGAVHSGALSGVLVAALAFLLMGAYEAVAPLGDAGQRAYACATSAGRLQEVSAMQPLVADPTVPRRPAKGISGSGSATEGPSTDGRESATETAPGTRRGSRSASGLAGDGLAHTQGLRLHDVHLRYGPSEPWVLRGAGLRLAPGERVALLGDSGAGKSTLAELLVRYRDPDDGVVTLDGADVRELTLDDLRTRVLVCGQDAHLFNTTIRENLLLACRDASDADIARVLDAVELREWVAELPEGLDTIVGEAGELVSGGQRQRIALARALLSPAPYLILDEPCAHLDAPLAERVTRSILALAADDGRGVLLIAHSTAGLEGCDRVLRLHAGTIATYEPVPA